MKLRLRCLTVVLAFLIALSATAVFHAEDIGEVDTEYVTEALNDYSLGYMSWGVKRMGLDKMQEKLVNSGRELPEVRVAVIDSGISKTNKYLRGRYTDDGYNFISNNSDFADDQYHGTMVSGIIIDGTPSNVKILPLKTNDANGRGAMSNVSKAIYYAIEHGADVINLSLSSDDPKHSLTVLDDAIKAATDNNIIVVAAAGNQSGDTYYRYPANKSEVFTITSIDSDYVIADSANTGAEVDFALPGVKIVAPYKSLMMVDSGTSLAAPHAAAAAAMLKTWNKSLTPYQVREILKLYSIDLGEAGFDTTYGWGMIDLSDFDLDTEVPAEPVEPPTQEPTEAATESALVILGDADGDGDVSISDVTVINRALSELPVQSFIEAAADVDGSGTADVVDATLLQRYFAEFIVPYPIGEPINI